jgi:hypothetical protein
MNKGTKILGIVVILVFVLMVFTTAATAENLLAPSYGVEQNTPTGISWVLDENGLPTDTVVITMTDGTLWEFHDFTIGLFAGVQDAIADGDECRFYYWVDVDGDLHIIAIVNLTTHPVFDEIEIPIIEDDY